MSFCCPVVDLGVAGGGAGALTTLFNETYDAAGGGLVTVASQFSFNTNQSPSINSTYFVSGAYSWQSNHNACTNGGNSVGWNSGAVHYTLAQFSTDVRRQDMPATNRPNKQFILKLLSTLGAGGPKMKIGVNPSNQLFVEDTDSGYMQLVSVVGAFTDNTWHNVKLKVSLNDPGVANGAIDVTLNGTVIYTTTTANIISITQAKYFNIFNNENDNALLNCPPIPTAPPAMLLYDNTKLEV